MGMDVYGKNSTSEVGRYFRNNVWYWHPLWDYCCDVDPNGAGRVVNGHSNDGDGLDACGAQLLATLLQAEIDTGATAKRQAGYEAEMAAKRAVAAPCQYCAGTGDRKDAAFCAIQNGEWKKECGGCNGCQGDGKERVPDYPFSVENVAKFVAFLRDCGGFEIC